MAFPDDLALGAHQPCSGDSPGLVLGRTTTVSDEVLDIVLVDVGLGLAIRFVGDPDDDQTTLPELLVELVQVRYLALARASPRRPFLNQY